NVEMVRSIGADEVVDYTREDFTKRGQAYDLILDVAASRPLSECLRVLASNGTLVLVGAPDGRRMGPMVARILAMIVLSRFASQKLLHFLAKNTREDLMFLKELVAAGMMRTVID